MDRERISSLPKSDQYLTKVLLREIFSGLIFSIKWKRGGVRAWTCEDRGSDLIVLDEEDENPVETFIHELLHIMYPTVEEEEVEQRGQQLYLSLSKEDLGLFEMILYKIEE